MSTLPPPADIDRNVPIVTQNAGSADAYKDPNSPESIMKKTHTMNVQSKVDGKYDVAQSPYEESFCLPDEYNFSPFVWVAVILLIVYFYGNRAKRPLSIYLCLIALVVILALYQKVWKSRID